jgi:murein DD-endopeptidase MepM/ murein hydrolase activator NlpD
MGKINYRYNPTTCKYEPWYAKGKVLRNRVLIFLTISFALALCCFGFYRSYFQSFDEFVLTEKNNTLKVEWQFLTDRVAKANAELSHLIDKDDNNYRVILDTNPLSPEVRQAGVGGSLKFNKEEIQNSALVLEGYTKLENLKHELSVEVQSFEELNNMLDEKIKMWAARPAIQPINNKQLIQLRMTYGSRFHPIFHIYRPHKGLDFAAAKGTPVYATGDGKVIMEYFSDTYGNVIYIDHDHHFETRYAHLSKFAVQPGELVKRGQVIGYVGNTGTSVSDHLHYEVLFNGQHVHPINFFQRDLSNKEYEKLIKQGSEHTDPLD